MRDVLVPVLERSGMRVDYRTDEAVLHADSLSRFDAMFIYNAKKGSKADGTPDLTLAQENALYAWVEAGHGVWRPWCDQQLPGESPLGGTARRLLHRAWQRSRRHHHRPAGASLPGRRQAAHSVGRRAGASTPQAGLTVLSTANTENTPWTWVRPQGRGWVYYTSSGHDERVWKDLDYQKQLTQALLWTYAASRTTTSLGPAVNRPSEAVGTPDAFGGISGVDALGRRHSAQQLKPYKTTILTYVIPGHTLPWE